MTSSSTARLPLFLVAVASATAVAWMATSHSAAEESTAAAESLSAIPFNFSAEAAGRIIYVETAMVDRKDGVPYTMLLSDAREATIGGRGFIVGVGRAPQGQEKDWFHGNKIAVPVESVQSLQFMTEAQFQDVFAKKSTPPR